MPKKIGLDWIEKNKSVIINLSDKIWEYAELGFKEFKSSKLIADTLEKYGFSVKLGVAGMPTAIVADWGSGKPVIGIQGEYDALPGLSQMTVPYKKPLKNGAPGHGCGHNIYGASGVGAVIASKVAMEEKEIQGTIKFFGCPAEEGGGGKIFMVRDGIYDDVEAVLYHHIGKVHCSDLWPSLATKGIKFIFHGKTVHVSSPWQGRSALHAVQLMNIGTEFMKEHLDPESVIGYMVDEGGGQPNVIPDRASTRYGIRARTNEDLEPIYSWICDIAEAAAKMTQTRLEIQFKGGCNERIINKTISELVVKNMREIGAPTYTEDELAFARKIGEMVTPEEKRTSIRWRPDWEALMDVDLCTEIIDPFGEGIWFGGATDSAEVSWQAPTTRFRTASTILGAPSHSWMTVALGGMSIGHKNALFGSKVLVSTALDLMTKPRLLMQATKEFEERKGGRTYKPPIPPEHKPELDRHSKRE